MRERTRAIAFCAIWMASLLALWSAVTAIAPKPVPPTDVAEVRLVIVAPGWELNYEATTRNNTVFRLLREANLTLGFELRWVEYGWPYNDVFITSINGARNDESKNLWWQYCVNAVYGEVGAAAQGIHDGDAVRWVYAPPGGHALCG